jgi:hypothetical protein
LAVLRNAVEDFQEYVHAQNGIEKSYSTERKSGFWRKMPIDFSLLRISLSPYSYRAVMYDRGCCHGRKQSSVTQYGG